MNTIDMENIGLGRELLAGASAVYPELFVGRIVSQSRDLYTAAAEKGELTAGSRESSALKPGLCPIFRRWVISCCSTGTRTRAATG